MNCGVPLLLRRDDLFFPDVFAEYEQKIFCFEFIAHIEVFITAFHMEALHTGVEIDQACCNASDADDGQAGFFTFGADEPSFLGIGIEGVSKNIDAIEPDFLGFLDTIRGGFSSLGPSGVD